MDANLKHRAWEALRFAASRSVISAAEEKAILAALATPPLPARGTLDPRLLARIRELSTTSTQDDHDRAVIMLLDAYEGQEAAHQEFRLQNDREWREKLAHAKASPELFHRAEAAESSLAEAKRLLKRCETQIVALYSSAAPMGNYENELTINGHVSGNNFADRDEVVKDARRFLSSGSRTMSAPIMKRMCAGCPFNIGDESTEMAYNLGCLPSVPEVRQLCDGRGTAWACHSSSRAVCAGFAEMFPQAIGRPLQHMEGVHG